MTFLPIALLACVSCSPGAEVSASPHEVGSSERDMSWVLNAGRGLINYEERETLWNAEERLVARCMTGLGWNYEPQQAVFFEEELEDAVVRRGVEAWQWDDPDLASEHGYGIAETGGIPEPEPPTNPNLDYVMSLSPSDQVQYAEDMNGRPDESIRLPLPEGGEISVGTQGCLASARRELFGSVEAFGEWHMLSIHFTELMPGAVFSDPEVDAALTTWRQCMMEQSFPSFSNPDEAFAFAHRYFRDAEFGRAEQDEMKQAVSDATCALTADLRRHAQEALKQLEQRLADDWLERVRQAERTLDIALTRAIALLQAVDS